MHDMAPGRVVLGKGFFGDVVELGAPRFFWSCTYDDLARVSPFEKLADVERSTRNQEFIAGFLSYECAMAVEPGLPLPPPPIEGPAAWIGVFRGARPFAAAASPRTSDQPKPTKLCNGLPAAQYRAAVKDIQERIARGDVFQVNFSHRQSAYFEPGHDLAAALPWQHALSADYAAVFDLGDFGVVSASPELFLSLDDGVLAAEPIKGTRPRYRNHAQDRAALEELLSDRKDRAENIMITDLMRNDLAKVCDDHSIREPVLCGHRSLDHVHHLYSRIVGRLRKDLGFADALRAAFPCGSVTGAPKWAAIRAISDLEAEGRGPYCGSIFAIQGGKAAASVAIRTAVIDNPSGRIDVRSGGGVTILSDPDDEYREALDKGYLFRLLAGLDDPGS